MRRSQQEKRAAPVGNAAPEAPKPSVVRTWLSGLSEAEPEIRLDGLGDILDRIRRAPLPAVVRFRSIEICRLALSQLRDELRRTLAGMTLPLHPEKEKLPRRLAHLHWLLAECYMRVARELTRGDTFQAEAAYLLRSCYRGIETLGEHLLVSCERYARPRQGTWLNIHKFYNMADAEGVQNTPLDPDSAPTRTVAHIYKRVLLLALSDPYRHPFRGVAQVYAQLDEWADLASLAVTPVSAGRCVFTVDPALDRPAMPALSRSSIRPELNERWLVTRELVDKLKRQHEKAVKEVANRGDRPESVTEELDSLQLLRRMIVSWGLHPIRYNNRVRTYKPCEVVIGLRAIGVALNGFKPLRAVETASRTAWMNIIKDSFHQKPDATQAARLSSEWEIADESDRGLRIVASVGEGPGVVSVGELIGYRTGETADWNIGTVHWAQTGDDNRLSLGIRSIKARAQPVLVAALHTDKLPEQAQSTALLLFHEADEKQTLSLLCDKRMYIPTGTYLLRGMEENGERVLEATKILQSTRSFVWFEACKPQGSSKQRTLDLLHPY